MKVSTNLLRKGETVEVDSPYIQGWMAWNEGEYERAMKWWCQVPGDHPKYGEVSRLIDKTLVNIEFDELPVRALQAYENMVSALNRRSFAEATRLYKETLTSLPAHSEAGKPARRVPLMMQTTADQASRGEDLQYCLRQAEQNLRKGLFEEAAKYYQRVLEIDPDSRSAESGRDESLVVLNELSELRKGLLAQRVLPIEDTRRVVDIIYHLGWIAPESQEIEEIKGLADEKARGLGASLIGKARGHLSASDLTLLLEDKISQCEKASELIDSARGLDADLTDLETLAGEVKARLVRLRDAGPILCQTGQLLLEDAIGADEIDAALLNLKFAASQAPQDAELLRVGLAIRKICIDRADAELRVPRFSMEEEHRANAWCERASQCPGSEADNEILRLNERINRRKRRAKIGWLFRQG